MSRQVKPCEPGGPVRARELHFIWICDCSGSMNESGKIQALNFACREALPLMKDAVDFIPQARVLMRVVAFSDSAHWVVATPTPLESFTWTDLTVEVTTGDDTMTGAAMKLVADGLKIPPMPERGLPPVLLLITDGQPTDDFNDGLEALMETPWGKHSIRLAVAIGTDADCHILARFIGNSEIPIMSGSGVDKIIRYIGWPFYQDPILISVPVSTSELTSPANPTPDLGSTSAPVTTPDPASTKDSEVR